MLRKDDFKFVKLKCFFGSNKKHFQEKASDLIFKRSDLHFTTVQTVQKLNCVTQLIYPSFQNEIFIDE